MKLLFEIGTEELPPGEIDGALAALVAHVERAAAAARLPIGPVQGFATPRRLALRVSDVAAIAETIEETVTGPAAKVAFDDAGNPTKAAIGFARGKGLDPSALFRVSTPKGDYVAATVRHEGASAADVLGAALNAAFDSIPWKRSMRWGWETVSFARPVHWIVALLGEQVLPMSFAGVTAGRESRGHRFLAPGAVTLASPDDYEAALRAAKVVVDVEERKATVLREVAAAAASAGANLIEDSELADEVKHLVEWPVALVGRFPEELLEVPREVLITSMRSHQRYFASEDAAGRLTNLFVFVSNMVVPDPDVVVRGNLRVLLARLEDAKFFYREDRKHTLEERLPRLESIRYIDGLGSLRDRAARIEAQVTTLAAGRLSSADAATAKRAATLCKADLTTGMVYEFPTLQGTMGRYYALLAGEPEGVAAAIEEHYSPRGASDAPPTSPAGVILSLADKLDAIAGCFALGLVPSGSADPYALRRAAIGLLRTCMVRDVQLDLPSAFAAAVALQPVAGIDAAAITAQCVEFVVARLRALLAAESATDIADAVAQSVGADLASAAARAQTLDRMRQNADFEPLAAAFKRTVNILRKASDEGVSAETLAVGPSAAMFEHDAERELAAAVAAAAPEVSAAVAARRFEAVAATLIAMKPSIDRFFDGVLVNAEDPTVRDNRLRLLSGVRALFFQFADLSRVQTESRAAREG
ncbi:MAG: glycine--tRNA ligase subunit beta [Myxococcales bacterium]|nr:glycine--tRNA ligase subunit beta [Myxococcales bacterium]MCB9519605.1 glycine--tRNA ligase subunit beta [Myxococcales bacterium]MCB9530668.1 glycine--tRNA ligase subunit beta [Myxococcales bacterium]MCB9533589.1 glycine--tRNA ligase subunit beta [Myxococcales bacterium]